MSTQLTQLAVGGLNAEAMAVALLGLLGRPVQMNDDVEQPGSTPLFGLLVAFEGRDNCYVCGSAVAEGVGGCVGFASLTHGARTAFLTSNGAGQRRAFMDVLQVLDNLRTTEALIQLQHTGAKA